MISKKDIPDHWEILEISDVIEDSINGGTPKRSENKYWGGQIPWLSSSEVRGKYTTADPEEHITQSGLDNSSAKTWPKDTVLVAMYGRGTIGRPAITTEGQSGNQAICGLIPDTEIIDTEFLYYWLEDIREQLADKGRGATASQQNLNQTIITETKIPVPPLDEQKQIVVSIEDKLSSVNDLEATVEELKLGVDEYKNSVLTFLFYEKDIGNREAIRGLPSEEDIPDHWDLVELSDAVKYHSNLLDPSDYPNNEFRVLELEDIEAHTGQITGTKNMVGSEIGSSKRQFNDEHILYCKLRPYLNKVVCPNFSGVASSELLVFEPEDEFLKEFIYYYLLSPPVFERAEALMTGANQPRIKKSSLMSFEIPKPPIKEQKEIVEQYSTAHSEYREIINMVENITNLFEEYKDSALFHAFRHKRSDEIQNGRQDQVTLTQYQSKE